MLQELYIKNVTQHENPSKQTVGLNNENNRGDSSDIAANKGNNFSCSESDNLALKQLTSTQKCEGIHSNSVTFTNFEKRTNTGSGENICGLDVCNNIKSCPSVTTKQDLAASACSLKTDSVREITGSSVQSTNHALTVNPSIAQSCESSLPGNNSEVQRNDSGLKEIVNNVVKQCDFFDDLDDALLMDVDLTSNAATENTAAGSLVLCIIIKKKFP